MTVREKLGVTAIYTRRQNERTDKPITCPTNQGQINHLAFVMLVPAESHNNPSFVPKCVRALANRLSLFSAQNDRYPLVFSIGTNLTQKRANHHTMGTFLMNEDVLDFVVKKFDSLSLSKLRQSTSIHAQRFGRHNAKLVPGLIDKLAHLFPDLGSDDSESDDSAEDFLTNRQKFLDDEAEESDGSFSE